MIDKIKQIVKQIINEATTNSTGSRGSYILPLKPGKRIFDKSQLGAYTTSVSKYYDQKLANDSYDGKMNTPKKEIDSLESKAKKISKHEKNNPLFSKDGKLNFVAGGIKNSNLNKISKPYDKKINEATSEIAGGLYNGPIELGMKKWEKNLLAPFIEFVDTDINHTKVKSTTKNNIKRTVGMWEKGKDGTYNVPTEYVHTMNEWKYEEAPILTEDLAVWFGTKKKPKGSKQPKGPWVDICRKVDGKHPPCGRSDADTKSYPKCRAAGVAGKMSDSEKKAACAQKRRAEKKEPKYGTGNKPTMVSYKPKTNESELIRIILKEDYDYPKFSVKNGKIIIDDKYTYQLQGYGGYLIGWLDIPVVELTESGDVLVMKYKKPPGYFITTDTINPNSIQYIKSNLGKNEIEPPIKEGKPKIRLVKK